MYSNRRNFTCINCSQPGHYLKECKEPITSYGILAYRIVNDDIQFLLIQRKDSMGFIDFIRGKYPTANKEMYLKTFVEEMVPDEQDKIRNKSFDDLWEDLWMNKLSKQYLNDYLDAKRKYKSLDIPDLFNGVTSRYIEREYGLPKGRRNCNESDLQTAIREFGEETGYNSCDYIIINKPPIIETFKGSNDIVYKHVYYVAEMITNREPMFDKSKISQAGEISQIVWLSYKECMKKIRDYDITKRDLVTRVYFYLKSKIKQNG